MKIKQMILKYLRKKRKTGFTMIEILIAMTIFGALTSTGAYTVTQTLPKARDATKKSDLKKISSALENYYNDHECYPSEVEMADCNDDNPALNPYLSKIPCDPKNKVAYTYKPLENNCRGYRIYADLENNKDPDIARLNCDTDLGCGWGGDYGMASGTTVFDPDGTGAVAAVEPTPTPSVVPTPTVSPSPTGYYYYACDLDGACSQYYARPGFGTCQHKFQNSNCDNMCSNPNLWCNL